MQERPHHLADTFKFSLLATEQASFRFSAQWQTLGIIVIGGVLAYFWHPAALAISAWGVYGAVAQIHNNIIRHLYALNDSLIAADQERAADALNRR